MRRICILVSVISVLALSCLGQAQKYEIPRLPGAKLLVRDMQDRILLTTESNTFVLPDKLTDAFLSMSADGEIIAAIRRIPGNSSQDTRNIISTYSLADKEWTDYAEFENFRGAFAISTDGSKIAYVMQDSPPDRPGEHWSLRILDLRTKESSIATKPAGNVGVISWSPDGRRVVFDMRSPGSRNLSDIRTICIADTKTGTISKLDLGLSPSWSPSGEWIAYLGYQSKPQRPDSFKSRRTITNHFHLSLMTPDGKYSKVIKGYRSSVVSVDKPVWSPDSKEFLFNEMTDPDNATLHIFLVDVVSGRAKDRFKNVGPVYAWVRDEGQGER